MDLVISAAGNVRCIYGEMIALAKLGAISITRASHVEPDDAGLWWADLASVDGPRLGPFNHRTDALHAESDWLRSYWLPT